MATIVTRSGKGTALTHAEMDANFTNLNTDKLETSRFPNVSGNVTSSHTELNYVDITTPGTQEATKAVITDANTNIGTTKVSSLYIGTSGSETQVTSTAAELNKLDGVSATAAEIDYRSLCFQVTLGTADDQHIVIPYTGNVIGVYTVIDQALTTADETLTFKNNAGTGMTNGVVTITQAASADGDVDSASPTANNSFTAGEKMTVSIGGENGTAALCNITVLIDIT